MEFAVVLYFDEDCERQITGIMNELCNAGVNRYMLDIGIRPHITLASWVCEDEKDITSEIESFALDVKGISVYFSSLGLFPTVPGVVYLSPVKNDDLINIHNTFYSKLNGKIENYIKYYMPNYWVPHCTLATKLNNDEVLKSVSLLLNIKLPAKAIVSQVGLIKCNPVKEILTYRVGFRDDLEVEKR